VQLVVWIQQQWGLTQASAAVTAVTAILYRTPTTTHNSVSVFVQFFLVTFDLRRKKKGLECVQEASVHTRSDRFIPIPPRFQSYTASFGEHWTKVFITFSQNFRLTLEDHCSCLWVGKSLTTDDCWRHCHVDWRHGELFAETNLSLPRMKKNEYHEIWEHFVFWTLKLSRS
jgi:hypothetical protein